jgi:hypothetical protein
MEDLLKTKFEEEDHSEAEEEDHSEAEEEDHSEKNHATVAPPRALVAYTQHVPTAVTAPTAPRSVVRLEVEEAFNLPRAIAPVLEAAVAFPDFLWARLPRMPLQQW